MSRFFATWAGNLTNGVIGKEIERRAQEGEDLSILENTGPIRYHAHTREVRISLCVHDGQAQVIVRDDGAGFDPALTPSMNGPKFGLQFMQERPPKWAGA
ncbi:MAG: hypothetical protein LAO03_23350 [Acidobacteriia bacterium]|nr:hypothetical protein [Terriglobia bacterium]